MTTSATRIGRAVLAGAVLASSGALVSATLVPGATVDESAARGIAFAPDDDCDLELAASIGDRHPGTRQLVLMVTNGFADSSGTVEVVVRDAAGTWRCQRAARPARFGRNGTRPLIDRRSGDGTTPAGIFPLGEVTAWDGERFAMFGNRPDPGVLAGYRVVHPDDCWGATAHTSRYQHLVRRPGCGGPDEWLVDYGDVYSHAAVIGANLDPVSGDEPGETPYAAAIFLHRHSYGSSGATKPTSGCVSLALDDLVPTLRIIDPRLEPHFAIGPREWLRATG